MASFRILVTRIFHPATPCSLARLGLIAAGMLLAAAGAPAQSRKLSGPLERVALGFVGEARISPDGKWVVYPATVESPGGGHLFSAPIEGGRSPIQLDDLGQDLHPFAISPDGLRVVYGDAPIRSVPIDRSPPPVAIAPTSSGAFQISPDGTRVLFLDSTPASGVQLFCAPIEGRGEPLQLTHSPADVADFQISPDGRAAAYRSDAQVRGRFELFGVLLDGSAPAVRLSGPLTGDGVLEGYRFSPDGSRVVHRGALGERIELFGAPLDGSAPAALLNGTLKQRANVQADFQITSDGLRVLYRASHEGANGLELFSASIVDGSGLSRLNLPFVPGRVVREFALGPDGRRAFYVAGVELQSGGSSLRFSPDSSRVFYIADQDTAGVHELYETPSARPPRSMQAGIDGKR